MSSIHARAMSLTPRTVKGCSPDNGGSIAVSAAIIGRELELVVADDGPGLDLRNGRLPKGGGVGLANTRERLKELYGDTQSFRLGTTEPHGLTITIRLPLEYGTETT